MTTTRVHTYAGDGTTLFLLDKKRGHQLDMPMSSLVMQHWTDSVDVSSAANQWTESVPVAQGIEIEIASLWQRTEESAYLWDSLQTGREFVLNGGVGDKAFHVPVYLTEVSIDFPDHTQSQTLLCLQGMGALQWGQHQPYRVVRFDVGDGSYKEIYLAAGETPTEVVERWYNKRGQWKW
jgi:hypothetical protein